MLPSKFNLADLMRPIRRVTKHMPLSELLETFPQGRRAFRPGRSRRQGGRLPDHGRRAGVLVGDIQDEHHKAERGVLAYQPGKLLVRGDPLFKIERLLGIDLDHIEAETRPGWSTRASTGCRKRTRCSRPRARIIIKKMKGPKIVPGQGAQARLKHWRAGLRPRACSAPGRLRP